MGKPSKEQFSRSPMGKIPVYQERLADSDLCLSPRGTRVWSPRLFENIWFGCIPVIIADNYYLPGECLLDWRQFAIFIGEKDANRTGEILWKWLQDSERLARTRERVLQVRQQLMWG